VNAAVACPARAWRSWMGLFSHPTTHLTGCPRGGRLFPVPLPDQRALGYDRSALRCSEILRCPAPRVRRLVFVARHVSSCCTLAQSRGRFSPWAGYAAKVRLAWGSYPHAGDPSSRRRALPKPKPCPMFCGFVTDLKCKRFRLLNRDGSTANWRRSTVLRRGAHYGEDIGAGE
jgi:hypothetical protein